MALVHDVHAEVLTRLGRVGIAARQAVESVLAGQHRSLRRGLSVEFAGHRPYQPGDDPRHLDWRVYARSDRLDIRLYEEETRLRATLVVDCSASMAYGSGVKLRQARLLAAALAALMVRQGDAVGLVLVDRGIRRHLPPASTTGHLLTLLREIEQAEPGGETALGPVLETLASRLTRRGLVIVVSDCLDDPDSVLRGLQRLHFRRQDLHCFQVRDADEAQFPFGGSCHFVGLEGDGDLRLDADRVRQLYLRAAAEHRRLLAAGCHNCRARYTEVRADDDLARVLVHALGGKNR